MSMRLPFKLIGLLFLVSQSLHAGIIHVDDNAAGLNNGSDWVNAFNSLTSALTASGNGDTIVVASGTYIPHAADRTIFFELKEGVIMLGGFAGTESDFSESALNERDLELNETTLSGDLNGDDDNFSNISENSYHVIYANLTSSSITSATVVDGFTISGGHANYFSYPQYDHLRGGGISLEADGAYECEPVFRNIIVEDNTAQFGAGICIVAQNTGAVCSPSFENFVVQNNQTLDADTSQVSSAGGVSINAINGTSNPIFNNGKILKNIVNEGKHSGTGGGLDISASVVAGTSESSPQFFDVLFCGNLAPSGSQIHTYAQGGGSTVAPEFTNITIAGGANSTPIFNRNTGVYNSINTPTYVNALINTTYPFSVYNYPAPSLQGPNPEYSYSNIRGVYGSGSWATGYGVDGGNNMDENSYFFDTTSCNVDLYDSSPEIGAGDAAEGNNIGYYQGPGLIKLSISSQSDFIACSESSDYSFRFAIKDEASDSTSYSLTLGEGNLTYEFVSDTIKNDTIDIVITPDEGWFGTDTISIVVSNLSGEYDSTDFTFSLAKKPTLTMYDLGVFDHADTTYSVVLYEDSTIVGETFALDGITTGSNYFPDLKPGYHYGIIEKDGCFSDTLHIDLPEYINDIPLEIVSLSDTSVLYVCQVDTTVTFEFKIEDDNLDHVEWMYNGNWTKTIPDENVTLFETDSSYYFSVVVPSDTSGFYRIHVHAENIYFELANLYFDIYMVPPPVIDSIQIQDYGFETCIYPAFSDVDYWTYNFSFYVDNILKGTVEICDLDYGTHTAVAYHESCPSNTVNFTLVEPEDPVDPSSIFESQQDELTIFPAPVIDFVSIKGLQSEAEVQVLDFSGKSLLHVKGIKEDESIDVTFIPTGSYIMLIKTDEKIISKQFIKK